MSMHRLPTPVAVVGGGFLGRRLVAALPRGVLVTTRSGTWSGEPPPEGTTVLPLDLTADGLALAPLHAAASLVVCVAPGRDGPAVDRRALYVEGTRRLLQELAPSGLRRVVHVGSTSALPDRDAWLDEDCPDRPRSERGAVQRDAEDVVARICEAQGVPWIVLRLGGLYGPGRDLSRVYARRAEGPLPGDGHHPTNLVHVDDAVTAVLAALAAPPDVSGVVHVVDDDHTPRRVMVERVAARLGVQPRRFAAEPHQLAPRGKRVSNLRLKLALGVRLRHPLHVLPEPVGELAAPGPLPPEPG